MRSALLVIFINLWISIGALPVLAQSDTKAFNNFGKITFTDGLFIPVNNNMNVLNVRFPYSLADATGTFIPAQFDANIKKPFSATLNCIGLGMEISIHRNLVNFAFDASPTFSPNGMYQVMLGFGRYWSLSKNGFDRELKSDSRFIVSASLAVAVMNRKQSLGVINNDSNAITAFNKTIQAEYTASPWGDADGDYVAKEMDVFFRQTAFGLMPHISISTTGKCFIELEFSYFLPLTESAAINIYKYDASGYPDAAYYLGAKSKLNQNAIVTKADNAVISNAPFALNNFQIKLKIGALFRDREAGK